MNCRGLTLACVACAALAPAGAAQTGVSGSAHVGISRFVEKGSSLGSLDARVGLFFDTHAGIEPGLELGYSGLGRQESRFSLGERFVSSVTGLELVSRKMWHATAVARHHFSFRGVPSFYAVGGSGLYLLYRSTRSSLFTASGNVIPTRSFEVRDKSLEFGMNLGGGITLGRFGPGAVTLDARVHILPFSTSEVSTLATFTAGLDFF